MYINVKMVIYYKFYIHTHVLLKGIRVYKIMKDYQVRGDGKVRNVILVLGSAFLLRALAISRSGGGECNERLSDVFENFVSLRRQGLAKDGMACETPWFGLDL